MNNEIIKNILSEELFGNRICESIEDQEILTIFYEGLRPIFEKFLWGEPISVPELRKLLRKSIVNFEFIKLDGEVRPARGTTMMKYIPQEDHPKGIRPSSDAVATFFDMDKEAWRSVSKKSKEIVLKKDEEKNRPIVVVQDKEEGLKKKNGEIEKSGAEPIDDLDVGDIRYYLNRNSRDIIIKITRIDDDGSLYAETFNEGTPFKIPAERVRNIGEKLTPDELKKLRTPVTAAPVISATPTAPVGTKTPELKPVTPNTPEGPKKEVIELKPIPDSEVKEQPEEVDDKEDAEELLK
jgi:hypothetical protein